MSDTGYLLRMAENAALEAGEAIMKVYRSGAFNTTLKADESPVTRADSNAHAVLTECLGKTNLPVLSEEGADIEFAKRRSWEFFWLIDPLDGTKEFISKIGEFTVNIALVRRDQPAGGVIYVPCSDTMYTGSKETGVCKREKGKLTTLPPRMERNRLEDLLQVEHITVAVSRFHLSAETKLFVNRFRNVTLRPAGSSLKFMMLLENQAVIYPRLGTTMEWDTAAAHAILNASNRGVYQQDMSAELRYNKPDLRNPYFIAF